MLQAKQRKNETSKKRKLQKKRQKKMKKTRSNTPFLSSPTCTSLIVSRIMTEPSAKRCFDDEEKQYKANRAVAVQVLSESMETNKMGGFQILSDKPTARDIVDAVRNVISALEEMHDKNPSFDLLTGALQECIKTATHLLSIEFSVATLEKLVDSGPWSRDWNKEEIEAFVFPGKTRVPLEPCLVVAFVTSNGVVCLREAPSSELRQLVSTYNMKETTKPDEGIFAFVGKSANEILAFSGEAVDSTATPQIYFVFASS
jgi:hypothetical protein